MKKYVPLRSRSGKFSLLLERKTVLVTFLLVLLTFLIVILSGSIGKTLLNPLEVIKIVLSNGNYDNTFIVESLRMPRVVLALLVGAGLGVSGAILQGIIGNPLASPDIIGITGGASVAAVTFITYFSASVSIGSLPFVAFGGAALVSLLIYFLAWNKGVSPIRLVLIGIGLAFSTDALTTLMVVLGPAYTTSNAYLWLTGSIYAANWDTVNTLWPWLIIFIPAALFFAKAVNVQGLGDHTATGLGASVQKHRFILLLISVALAGSSVAAAGGIGFVGLIAPHISRKLVGNSFGSVALVSAFIGGLVVALADLLARTAFLPLDIPAGVFTAAIGAPFFIYLLYRNRNTKAY